MTTQHVEEFQIGQEMFSNVSPAKKLCDGLLVSGIHRHFCASLLRVGKFMDNVSTMLVVLSLTLQQRGHQVALLLLILGVTAWWHLQECHQPSPLEKAATVFLDFCCFWTTGFFIPWCLWRKSLWMLRVPPFCFYCHFWLQELVKQHSVSSYIWDRIML